MRRFDPDVEALVAVTVLVVVALIALAKWLEL